MEEMEGGGFNGKREVKAWRREENRLSSKWNPLAPVQYASPLLG